MSRFSTHRLSNEDFGRPDLSGAACEHLMKQFADPAGNNGGEFHSPYLLYRLGVIDSEQWWTGSIAGVVVIVIARFTANTKIRVQIRDDNVSIYSGGMVQGDFSKNSVSRVTVLGRGGNQRLEIVTTDGLRFHARTSCFSDSELKEMISNLEHA